MAKEDNNKITPTISNRRTIMGNRKTKQEQQDIDFMKMTFRQQEKLLRDILNQFKNDKTEEAQLSVLKDLLKFIKSSTSESNIKSKEDARKFLDLNRRAEEIVLSLKEKANKKELMSFSESLEKYAKDTGKRQEDLQKLFLRNIDDIMKDRPSTATLAGKVEKTVARSDIAKGALEFVGQVFAAPVLATVKSSRSFQRYVKELEDQRIADEADARKQQAKIRAIKEREWIEAAVEERAIKFKDIELGEKKKPREEELIEQERQQEIKMAADRENSNEIVTTISKGHDRIIDALGGETKREGKKKDETVGLVASLKKKFTELGSSVSLASLGLSGLKNIISGIGGVGSSALSAVGGGSALAGGAVIGGAVVAAEVAYLGKIAYDTKKARDYTAKLGKETLERKRKLIAIRLAKRHGKDVTAIEDMLEKTSYNVIAVDGILAKEAQMDRGIAQVEKTPAMTREEEIMSRVAGGEQIAAVPREITRTARELKKTEVVREVMTAPYEIDLGITEKEKPYREISIPLHEVDSGVREVGTPVRQVAVPYHEVPAPVREIETTTATGAKKKSIIRTGLTPQQEALMGRRKRVVREVGTPVSVVPEPATATTATLAATSTMPKLTPQQERLMRRQRGVEVEKPVKEVEFPTETMVSQEIAQQDMVRPAESVSEAQKRLLDVRTRKQGTLARETVKEVAVEVKPADAPRADDVTVRETHELLKEIKTSIDNNMQAPTQVPIDQYAPSPSASQMPNNVDDLGLVITNMGGI